MALMLARRPHEIDRPRLSPGGRRRPIAARIVLAPFVLTSEAITELSQAAPLESEWDELAVASQLPLMSPACVTAWWQHLAPAGAEPRMIAVRDGEALVGFAPLYAVRDRRRGGLVLRLPGIELAGRLAPLALPGREREVAGAIVKALADPRLRPDLVLLEGAPLTADWARALGERWPGKRRPIDCRYQVLGSPTVSLREDSFEEWLGAKSSNFRREMRRLRRQFAAAGGKARLSTGETLSADVAAFVRMHSSRWEGRGGSSFIGLGSRLAEVLQDIGQRLLTREGRFRLRVLEAQGEPISAQLFLAAGDRVLYVNGGWDERFASLKPSMLGILAEIEEAFERGERRVDLGLGEQHYKLRFADGSDPVVWSILIAPGVRLPLTLLCTAPMRARAKLRRVLVNRLSEERIGRLRMLRERTGSWM
jgi:CelD/BcsL family acetyltransferase involved in cellulose biosynthesis